MKYRKFLGIALMILGFVLALSLLVYTVLHAVDMWNNAGKYHDFDHLFQYYFSFNKGGILISFGVWLLLWLPGFRLFRRAAKCPK